MNMSSYYQTTKNPNTGKWEEAFWLDDYYGNHNYGVQFPSNPDIMVDPREIELEVDRDRDPEVPHPSNPSRIDYIPRGLTPEKKQRIKFLVLHRPNRSTPEIYQLNKKSQNGTFTGMVVDIRLDIKNRVPEVVFENGNKVAFINSQFDVGHALEN